MSTTTRMLTVLGAGLASAQIMAGMAGTATAQAYGHGYHKPSHHVCHVEVRSEPTYGVVKKPVVKQPGRWELKDHAAVYGEVTRKILVKPGEWEVKTTPAVYEDRERQVLVKPAHTVVHVTPPVYKYEKVAKKVVDPYGHEKVVHVEQPVLVEAAKRTVEKQPAVYKTFKFKALVKPEHHQKVYHQPVYETKAEKVIVKPAYQERIYHKPVVDYVDERVVLKPATVFRKAVWKPHGEAC
jgi:hypothetical protein